MDSLSCLAQAVCPSYGLCREVVAAEVALVASVRVDAGAAGGTAEIGDIEVPGSCFTAKELLPEAQGEHAGMAG